MSHFTQRLVIGATPAAVYAALTTPTGLRAWWTQDCDVDTRRGGRLHFRFGRNHKEMRIETLAPDAVEWRCTAAAIVTAGLARQDEWVGTRIVFRLTPEGACRTRLEFSHIGLTPALECYDLCRGGWQYFLASLQQYLETGRGTPHEAAALRCAPEPSEQQGVNPA